MTLVAAILGSGIVFLDQTVVNVALPAIRSDLDTGLVAQQWVVEAYLLTLGALLLVGGSLGDRLGRRRVFNAGLIGFGVTSLLCAIAPDPVTLIVARALQGMAGAMLVPSSLALISANYPAERRGWAIGQWTAWTTLAFIIGPLGGGALVELASWRWIFLINIPLVAGTLWLARRIPESGARSDEPLDLIGASLCALGLAGPVFALIEQPVYGWASPVVLIPLIAGLLLFTGFIAWERGAASPMLPLACFRARNFVVGNISTFAIYGGLGAASLYLTLFLQQVSGYSAIEAGMALVPVTLVMWATAGRFGALADRFGPRAFMGGGPIVAGAGLLWMAQLDADVDYFTELFPGVMIFAVGLSATVAPLTATVLSAVDESLAGVASGANNAIARVAGLVAIAAIGAILSAKYVAALAGTSVSGEARERVLSGGSALVEQASVEAFVLGGTVAAGLVAAGGLVALLGIANPSRAQ